MLAFLLFGSLSWMCIGDAASCDVKTGLRETVIGDKKLVILRCSADKKSYINKKIVEGKIHYAHETPYFPPRRGINHVRDGPLSNAQAEIPR